MSACVDCEVIGNELTPLHRLVLLFLFNDSYFQTTGQKKPDSHHSHSGYIFGTYRSDDREPLCRKSSMIFTSRCQPPAGLRLPTFWQTPFSCRSGESWAIRSAARKSTLWDSSCSLSADSRRTVVELIVDDSFRVIQAIAGSADYPTAMAILAVTYTDERSVRKRLESGQRRLQAAAVFGPLIGGPLIDNFNWRAVFLINLPVGLVGLFMALTYIEESVSDKKTRVFDWFGAITLGISLSSFVLVLDKGIEWGWFSVSSLICYAVTIAFLGIFIRIESTHPEPIVDLKFFKNDIFVRALMNNFIIFHGADGQRVLVPVFAQTFLGYTATQAGYILSRWQSG